MGLSRENMLFHWRTHRYFYILIAVVVFANILVFAELVSDWYNDANYSHGFLVIPIVVFLLWKKRRELLFPSRQSGWGVLLFAFGAVCLILGTAAREFFTTRMSLIIIISGISLYHLGTGNFKKVWFAFAFLVFMVPLPAVIYYSATMPMQLFSSKVTNFALHLLSVPSVRQGNVIFLPQYTLEVVEACSGLRSLVSLLALSALYGHLTLPSVIRPLILFAAAVPIAITVNIVRLIVTAIGAYSVSPQFAEGFLHQIAGISIFIIAFVLVGILGSILKWTRRHS